MSRRLQVALAAGLFVVLSTDVFLLATGIHSKGAEKRRESSLYSESLVQRSKKLSQAQNKTNDLRSAISDALDKIDTVHNLGRTPGGSGLTQAQSEFDAATKAMDAARRAVVELPAITDQIKSEAAAGRKDIARLLRIVEERKDIVYLKKLDEALRLLLETHEIYSAMNAGFTEGFPLYEKLLERTNAFLKDFAARKYRNPKDASQVYSLSTSDLVGGLSGFRQRILENEQKASIKGAETLRAFRDAARLRPRTAEEG